MAAFAEKPNKHTLKVITSHMLILWTDDSIIWLIELFNKEIKQVDFKSIIVGASSNTC